MTRYSIIIEGNIQGVGFRSFTQIAARRLHLTGWCKNLIDGNVQIEIQGLDENITLFIAIIKQGNNFIRVSDVYSTNVPIIYSEKKFIVKY